MALNTPKVSRTNGTSSASFRIADSTGISSANVVAIQNVSGVAKLFKADGTTLAKLQVAAPTTNDDVSTKSYVDTGLNSAEQVVAIPLALNSPASVNSTYALPNNTYVTKVTVFVTTAFDGTGGTVSVGYTGQTSKYMATGGNNLKTIGVYTRDQYTQQNSGSAQTVLLSYTAPTGGPTTGAATVLVWFAVVPKT